MSARGSDLLSFSVDAQLIGELGERLVTKNHVALAELIKNAFDADATEVTISFERSKSKSPSSRKASKIIVEDNGVGMNRSDVENHWMRIATAHKQRQLHSTVYGRLRTGSKGIGRFACERLAHHLKLETVSKDSAGGPAATTVEFDWDQYEAGKSLPEITHRVVTQDTQSETFTRLTMTELRDIWTQGDFNTLRREIIDLTVAKPSRRRGYESDPGFNIRLAAPEFEFGEGTLFQQFMGAGWGLLSGKFDSRGRGTLTLEHKDPGSSDGGSKIESIDFPERVPTLKGISFEFAFLPIIKSAWRDRRTVNLNTVKEALRENGGIRIYQNQFRIFPYGSAGDDWLRLEFDAARRRAKFDNKFLNAMAARLNLDVERLALDTPRYRSLYGSVFIDSSKNNSFTVNISRDGLIENQAYTALRGALRFGIQWLTIHYSLYKDAIREQVTQESRSRLLGESSVSNVDSLSSQQRRESTRAALKILDQAGSIDHRPTLKQQEAIRDAYTVVNADLQGRQGELALLRAFSSTGPLVFAFTHEVQSVITEMATFSRRLLTIARTMKGRDRKTALDLARRLENTKNRFNGLTHLFNVAGNAANLTPKRFLLLDVVEQIELAFSFVLESYSISWTTDIPKRVKTPQITQAELQSILVNLVSNAIKSNFASSEPPRAINVSARNKDDELVVSIDDKGIGLPETHWLSVFEPMVSDPTGDLYGEDQKIGDESIFLLGRGSGLGLSIAKDIVEYYGGSIAFHAPPAEWRARITFTLPMN